MNPRSGKQQPHGSKDDMPVREWRLQKAPSVCFGEQRGLCVLWELSRGEGEGGQVWKECRPGILSFPGSNMGSMC